MPDNPNKKDIRDAISYINEEQASKAWLFVKERETLCFTFYEFIELVTSFPFYLYICFFQTVSFRHLKGTSHGNVAALLILPNTM